MKAILLVGVLFFNLAYVQAQTTCQAMTLGGVVDIFPWSEVRPFPWSKIQGTWKMAGDEDTLIKFKILKQTSTIKQLDIKFYSKEEGCQTPIIKGKGFITTIEKDIVRLSAGGKLFMFAMFTAEQLKINNNACSGDLMIANIVDLSKQAYDNVSDYFIYENSSYVLQKVSNSLDVSCKK